MNCTKNFQMLCTWTGRINRWRIILFCMPISFFFNREDGNRLHYDNLLVISIISELKNNFSLIGSIVMENICLNEPLNYVGQSAQKVGHQQVDRDFHDWNDHFPFDRWKGMERSCQSESVWLQSNLIYIPDRLVNGTCIIVR